MGDRRLVCCALTGKFTSSWVTAINSFLSVCHLPSILRPFLEISEAVKGAGLGCQRGRDPLLPGTEAAQSGWRTSLAPDTIHSQVEGGSLIFVLVVRPFLPL